MSGLCRAHRIAPNTIVLPTDLAAHYVLVLVQDGARRTVSIWRQFQSEFILSPEVHNWSF